MQSKVINQAISEIVKDAFKAGLSFSITNKDGLQMNPTRAMLKYLHKNGWYVPEHFIASLGCEEDERKQCVRSDIERKNNIF